MGGRRRRSRPSRSLATTPLLDAAIELHGGVRPVEQGEGDSVVAAFTKPSDAVAAALDVQRAFLEEPWPETATVRVRMALHTGEIDLRDAGNYFGPTIIRCARLRNAAHGGQTVLSSTTHDLVVDRLPDGVELRDLGPHRFKDLGRAERIWQLCHPDLADEFPPLRSLDALPNNLPVQLTTFVGRDAEIAELGRAHGAQPVGHADRHRRLRKDAARARERRRRRRSSPRRRVVGGARPGRDPELVAATDRPRPSACARSSTDRSSTRWSSSCTTATRCSSLDNCEQVLDGAARVLEALLVGVPDLRVVATSREPIGVPARSRGGFRRSTSVGREASSWSGRARRGPASRPTRSSSSRSRRSVDGSTAFRSRSSSRQPESG